MSLNFFMSLLVIFLTSYTFFSLLKNSSTYTSSSYYSSSLPGLPYSALGLSFFSA